MFARRIARLVGQRTEAFVLGLAPALGRKTRHDRAARRALVKMRADRPGRRLVRWFVQEQPEVYRIGARGSRAHGGSIFGSLLCVSMLDERPGHIVNQVSFGR
jgi:hypothetical protein